MVNQCAFLDKGEICELKLHTITCLDLHYAGKHWRNNELQNHIKWPLVKPRLHRKSNNKPKFTYIFILFLYRYLCLYLYILATIVKPHYFEVPREKDHLWRWTTLTGKFPPGQNRSIYVWTEISGNFRIMGSTQGFWYIERNRDLVQCSHDVFCQLGGTF